MLDIIKNKTTLTIIALLIGTIIALFMYMKLEFSRLEKENLDLIEEKKTELKMARDSAFMKIQELTDRSQIKFDSILEISQEIKYIPYEKLIYADRNLDDALDIISNYRYNERAKQPD